MSKVILNAEQLARLSKVIGSCEQKTSGEIRLIIAKRSSVIGHVFPMTAAVLVLILVSTIWSLGLLWPSWMLGLAIAATTGVAYGLSKTDVVRRLFSLREDLNRQVWWRAQREFYSAKMEQTDARTGILLFLSLMEHQVVVLADQGIASKLPQDTWVEVVRMTLDGAKKGLWEPSLQAAIEHCGGLLNKHFPIQAGDKDELPNHVLLVD